MAHNDSEFGGWKLLGVSVLVVLGDSHLNKQQSQPSDLEIDDPRYFRAQCSNLLRDRGLEFLGGSDSVRDECLGKWEESPKES